MGKATITVNECELAARSVAGCYSEEYVKRLNAARRGSQVQMENVARIGSETESSSEERTSAGMAAQGYDDDAIAGHTSSKENSIVNGKTGNSSKNCTVNNVEGSDSEYRFPFKSIINTRSRSRLEEEEKYLVDVHFAHPLRAVAPGQYAVLYYGAVCLGAAQILQQGPSLHQLGHTEPVALHSTFT